MGRQQVGWGGVGYACRSFDDAHIRGHRLLISDKPDVGSQMFPHPAEKYRHGDPW